MNAEVYLRRNFFFNSRYEFIYGDELGWTPGGQFSNILQQKFKQFLKPNGQFVTL